MKTINKLTGNIWLKGLFGIEKENLRVDTNGRLALTPHPKAFENRVFHPYITTDFSESQVEMITPPLPSIKQSLLFLENIQDIVNNELNDEFLWPQSMPPIIPSDNEIPISEYYCCGETESEYRNLLAKKYGKERQMFSGIHFNFSFDESLLKTYYKTGNKQVSYEKFRENTYLKTTRQLLRLRWFYLLLYSFSPSHNGINKPLCHPKGRSVDAYKNKISIRNSCYGYKNLEELYPDYSSTEKYFESINKMIADGKISSEKELYSPVRIKFKPNSKKISHLELRFLDINPFEKIGIKANQLRILHLLAIYGLLSDEPNSFDDKHQQMANLNHNSVALHGLNTELQLLNDNNKEVNAISEAKKIIKTLKLFQQKLQIKNKVYVDTVKELQKLLTTNKNKPIEELLNLNFLDFNLLNAKKYSTVNNRQSFILKGYEDMELSTQLLLKESIRQGIQFEIIDREENFIKLRKQNKVQYVKQATKTSLDNYASILAMENKTVTKKILREHKISTPAGQEYQLANTAFINYELHKNKPIVIKPKQTNFGKGIHILKTHSEEQFKHAVHDAFKYDSAILIEEFIAGNEYRFFVINNKTEAILRREPANVIGNSKHTIRELIKLKNNNLLRGKNYTTPLEKINIGAKELNELQNQGISIDYIPAKGEKIFLRKTSNISTGGDSIDYTDDIHESYKEIAVKAAKALQVNITGLDMIIKDYKLPANPDNYSIIELNFNPAIHIHCYPYKGKNRKLDAKILEALGY